KNLKIFLNNHKNEIQGFNLNADLEDKEYQGATPLWIMWFMSKQNEPFLLHKFLEHPEIYSVNSLNTTVLTGPYKGTTVLWMLLNRLQFESDKYCEEIFDKISEDQFKQLDWTARSENEKSNLENLAYLFDQRGFWNKSKWLENYLNYVPFTK